MSSKVKQKGGFKLMKSSSELLRVKKQLSAQQVGYFPGQLAFSAVGKAAYSHLVGNTEDDVVIPLVVPESFPKIRVGKRPMRTVMTMLLTPSSWIDDLEAQVPPSLVAHAQSLIIGWVESGREAARGLLGLKPGDTTTVADVADAAYGVVRGEDFAELSEILAAIGSHYENGESFQEQANLVAKLTRNIAAAATASLLPAVGSDASDHSESFSELLGGIIQDEGDAPEAPKKGDQLVVSIGGVALSITRDRSLTSNGPGRYTFKVESEPKEKGSGVLESSKYRPNELEIGEHTLTVVAGKTGTGKTALVDSLPGATKILFYETHSVADEQDGAADRVSTAWDMVELVTHITASQSDLVVIDSIRRLAFSGKGPMAAGGFSMDVLFDLITLRAVANFVGKRLVVTLNPVDELMNAAEELAFVLRIASSVPVIHVVRQNESVRATYYDRGILRAATPLNWQPGQAVVDLPFLDGGRSADSESGAHASDTNLEPLAAEPTDGHETLRVDGTIKATFKLPRRTGSIEPENLAVSDSTGDQHAIR